MGHAMRQVRHAFTRLLPILLLAGAAPMTADAQPTPPPPPENVVAAAQTLAAAPKAEIANGVLKATLLLPTGDQRFYKGTRFDHGGVIASLTYKGQEYYGLWFDATATNVRDYVFHQGQIVTSLNTGIMGPAEAFDADNPPGFTDAPADGRFLKIGVGVLKKPADGQNYSSFRMYEVLDAGKWAVAPAKDHVTFTHTLTDAASGFGYVYVKTVRLVPGQPQMRIEHSLKNTGAKALTTTMFNHNFLTLGGSPTREGVTVDVPFAIQPTRTPKPELASLEGGKITYKRPLGDGETVFAQFTGFGPTAADNRFTVTAPNGAGYTVQGDRPLSAAAVWSIRSNISAEPFVTITAAPGQTATWSSTYTYAAPQGR